MRGKAFKTAGQGLEPRICAPEAHVLPITPARNAPESLARRELSQVAVRAPEQGLCLVAADVHTLSQQRPRVRQVLRALDHERSRDFPILDVEDGELAY